MGRGNPSKHTLRVKYNDEARGFTSKAFKIDENLADEFADTCERMGRSQASVIMELMREYIDEHEFTFS